MFDEPEESPAKRAIKPADAAKDKSDELRMHAELAAVFEGPRKFDAELIPGLSPEMAREIQRTMGKLEKSKSPNSPVLPPELAADAAALLSFPASRDVTTNNYHIHRRPGEVMIVRWLAEDQVETFYGRLQAHFEAGLEGLKEDERQAKEWKQDPQTQAYLEALDKIEIKMPETYLREPIRKLKIFVLSTQTADEMNIAFIADQIMSIPAADLVGNASAPGDAPTERDLAWFFKLFSLRGIVDGVERMCFFTFLQKSDDDGW